MVSPLFYSGQPTLSYSHSADIMRARIRTMGVEEHHFVIEKGNSAEPRGLLYIHL